MPGTYFLTFSEYTFRFADIFTDLNDMITVADRFIAKQLMIPISFPVFSHQNSGGIVGNHRAGLNLNSFAGG